jgi:DNA repair protein RadA/Sms
MVKQKSRYVCQKCGVSYAKWAGRCENCGEWNTLLEQVVPTEQEIKGALARGAVSGKKLQAVSINTIESTDIGERLSTGFLDLNTVLGGGILLGSVSLLAGQPGIGKSTLLMQICAKISNDNHNAYIYIRDNNGNIPTSDVNISILVNLK